MARIVPALTALPILAAAALAAAAPTPPVTVLSFWNVANNQFALKQVAGQWKLVNPVIPTGDEITLKGPVTVDLANGWLTLRYAAMASDVTATAALFTASGGRVFLVAGFYDNASEYTSSTVRAWSDQEARALEEGKLVPTVELADFLDPAWLEKHPAARAELKVAGIVAWEIPRYGTTIVARPQPLKSADDGNVGTDREEIKRALATFHARWKYKAIRIAWNQATATFSIAGKDPK